VSLTLLQLCGQSARLCGIRIGCDAMSIPIVPSIFKLTFVLNDGQSGPGRRWRRDDNMAYGVCNLEEAGMHTGMVN
jgi:hypothetical protein